MQEKTNNSNLISDFGKDLQDFISDWSALGIKSVKVELEPQDASTMIEVSEKLNGFITKSHILELELVIMKEPKVSILLIADSPLNKMCEADRIEEQGIEQLENERQD